MKIHWWLLQHVDWSYWWKWHQFKDTFNNFGILKWDIEVPSCEVNYSDWTIMLNNGRITAKIYQKTINLYLYIPPHSAHPPGMIKGVIFGILRHYFEQNSDKKDFIYVTKLFFKGLIARGWDPATIKPIFLSVFDKIQNETPSTNTSNHLPLPIKRGQFSTLHIIPWTSLDGKLGKSIKRNSKRSLNRR